MLRVVHMHNYLIKCASGFVTVRLIMFAFAMETACLARGMTIYICEKLTKMQMQSALTVLRWIGWPEFAAADRLG